MGYWKYRKPIGKKLAYMLIKVFQGKVWFQRNKQSFLSKKLKKGKLKPQAGRDRIRVLFSRFNNVSKQFVFYAMPAFVIVYEGQYVLQDTSFTKYYISLKNCLLTGYIYAL